MKKYRVALAGNPNCGKSAIFNALTGEKQHVGNWPGVTVEKKTGFLKLDDMSLEIIDLPGIYSLSSYSLDEKVTTEFLIHEKPDLVVAVVDASNLERNFYLVSQLMEMGNNVVICLNMVDIAIQKGIRIKRKVLENILNLPVVKTVASKNEGIEELKQVIFSGLSGEHRKLIVDYGYEIEDILEFLAKNFAVPADMNERFFFLNILEGDNYFLELLSNEHKEKMKELLKKYSQIYDNELESIVVEKRYAYVHGLVRKVISKHMNIRAMMDLTEKIDRVLINRFFGIPLFLLIMWVTFELVFTVGGPVSDLIESSITFFSDFIALRLAGKVSPMFISFITEGIINGVGAVITFLPNIFILYVAISILEDSGYMSRAAFIMDRFMHLLGLHGKSFIPMVMGFGCTVPGVMACRTFEYRKDRVITVLLLPLMSCAAKLPIYTLFAGVFFEKWAGTVVFSLYITGIVISVFLGKLFKTLFFSEEISPLIMELPPYHLPQWKSIFKYAAYRSGLFLKKAGTLILGGVVVIWLLASMPVGVEYASADSAIGKIGSFIAPILAPAGFGNWKVAVSLLFGILAKEVVVGTLGTLASTADLPLSEGLRHMFTPLSAYAFMIMALIYCPCMAAVASIKQEIGLRWAVFAVIYTTGLAWIMAVIVYQLGSFLL